MESKRFGEKSQLQPQAISAVEQVGYKRHSLPLLLLRRIARVLDADVVVALVP